MNREEISIILSPLSFLRFLPLFSSPIKTISSNPRKVAHQTVRKVWIFTLGKGKDWRLMTVAPKSTSILGIYSPFYLYLITALLSLITLADDIPEWHHIIGTQHQETTHLPIINNPKYGTSHVKTSLSLITMPNRGMGRRRGVSIDWSLENSHLPYSSSLFRSVTTISSSTTSTRLLSHHNRHTFCLSFLPSIVHWLAGEGWGGRERREEVNDTE